MLPRNYLATIQEDEEVHEGFFVRVFVEPHEERVFGGLMSLEEVLDATETTSVEYQSYSCRITGNMSGKQRNDILSRSKLAIRQQSKLAFPPQ